MKPGEIITKQNSDINLNAEKQSITIKVSNTGDRPIQVGSHYHFAETNEFLKFDRKKQMVCVWIYHLVQLLDFAIKRCRVNSNFRR